MKRAVAIAVLCLGLLLPGPSSRGQTSRADISVAELSAYLQARPAFERNCFRCHSVRGDEAKRKTLEQLNMTRYPFGGIRGPFAGRVIRKSLTGPVGQRTMPKDDPSSLSADDLALILKWSDAFDVARAKNNSGADP